MMAICLGTAVNAETCPPAPDLEPDKSRVLEAVRTAPTELRAREMANEMWELWTRAPDVTAQELLNEGIDRREAFDFAGALAALNALVEYCPNYAEGYNQRAFVNFIRQDYALAIVDLDRALDLSPDHFAAMSGKALSLLGLGRLDEAHVVLREALTLNPWLPERGFLPELQGEPI
jgi:tetratricopeptide (TPR) repeat protein